MSAAKIIGHRGACGHAPENTLVSIKKAKELGVAWVEFDTMLSADGHVIVFHDDLLKRTTGAPGNVAETNWGDLQKLDAGTWFSDDFTGEGIPDLVSTIALLEKLELGAVVEIKPCEGHDRETAEKMVEVVREYWPTSLPTPIFSSFSEASLSVVQKLAPEIPRALNVWTTLDGCLERAQKLECVAVHSQHDLIDEKSATDILDAGFSLRCFTVNNRERADLLFSLGVEGIFSDFPDRFL